MDAISSFLLFGALGIVLLPLYGVIRLINWIAGRKLAPVWLPLTLGIGALMLGSWWLDTAGVVAPARIMAKHDSVRLHTEHGSWHRGLSIEVAYQTPGDAEPTTFLIRTTPKRFDALHVGDQVEVRVLDYSQHFRFARLADSSTLSLITDLFPDRPSGSWRDATATVVQVDHIDRVTFRGRHGSHRSYLAWPYDIVQVTFVPSGHTDPITLVDAVETTSLPALQPGGEVRVRYSSANPRRGFLVGAKRASLAKNLAFEFALHITATVVLFGALGFWWRKRKRRARVAATPA